MKNDIDLDSQSLSSSHSSLTSYSLGFGLSLALTLLTYFAVVNHWLTGTSLIVLILTLAIIQLFVQSVFFLHLSRESKPQWNLMAFLFMLLVLFIIVVGSIWIMNNLNYNMMLSPEEMDEYMKVESDKGF